MDAARRRVLDQAAYEFDEIAPTVLAQMITEEAEAIAAEARAGKYIGEQRTLRQYAMQHSLAYRFGSERHWALSRYRFELGTLQRGKQHSGSRYPEAGGGFFGELSRFFDHPYFYRRERKAAAIVAHLYSLGESNSADREHCEALAIRLGLRFETPDFPSWWNPGRTIMVAYIGPAGR
jgi:hypothetical protein